MDSFYEQLIQTQKTFMYNLVNAATYVFGFIALLMFSTIFRVGVPAIILVALIAGASVGCFFLKRNLYVEYEYILTNGQIDIDKIMEMKTRKRVVEFEIKNVELLAPENSDEVKDFANKPQKILNCAPKDSDKAYIAMLTKGQEAMQIRFQPDEEFLTLCHKFNPRAVKKY